MTTGKYDLESRTILLTSHADAVIVIVMGEPEVAGMSVSTTEPGFYLKIPAVLRVVADAIAEKNKAQANS